MYMPKILTKAEKLVNEQTLAMLEWASDASPTAGLRAAFPQLRETLVPPFVCEARTQAGSALSMSSCRWDR
jgi:hypothetical protein